MSRIIKFIDSLFFPNLTEKHWKLYRKYLSSKNKIRKFFLLSKIMKLQRKFNASIPVSKKIVPFETPHGLSGIFISAAATIGEGCIIFQNVTIGSNTIPGHPRNGAPAIGKGVMIGANAVVIGNVTVGDNARIGAGCALAKDLPANATAVSQAPRIIVSECERTNTFRTITENN